MGQARWRLRGKVRPRNFRAATPAQAVLSTPTPFLGAARHVSYDGAQCIELLNRKVDFHDGIDWGYAKEGPLWMYHLHHHEYLLLPNLSAAQRWAVISDWIENVSQGPGWDSHPTGERVMNWIKLLLTPGALELSAKERERFFRSIASQVETLAANLETHILANHYLFNLMAVIFAGLVFEGRTADRWLKRYERMLRQLDEQILVDGAHYERSPMYHSLILEHVLDLLNVGAEGAGRSTTALVRKLRNKAQEMLSALELWTHPDQEIALFADSAFGIAPAPPELVAYADALGLEARAPIRHGLLGDAGFVRLEGGPFVLIASVAGPMPAYQPGHAHADALSFELSVGKSRVVTDTGVTEYIPGKLRDWSRTVRAHATLQLDGQEQAEFWGAHRVGGRPKVGLINLVDGRSAEAACRGWNTLGTAHHRIFEVREQEVLLHDRLEGKLCRVRLTLPLAPGLDLKLEAGNARVPLPDGSQLEIELPKNAEWHQELQVAFPEFGAIAQRSLLIGEAEQQRSFEWRIRLLPK